MCTRPNVLATLLACSLITALSAAPRHSILLREAATAAQAGNPTLTLAKLEEAARLRPDYPRIQINLARTYAAQGRTEEAITALQRLADMGLQMPVSRDPSFESLKTIPAFVAVAARLTAGPARTPPVGENAFVLPGVTGIIESCLVDPETHEWYFGDVRNRCIWRRDATTKDGQLRVFTTDADQLDGVFRIALSPDRQTLWAATATVGVMTGADAEDGKRTSLVAFDYATGRVRARYPVPGDGRPHLLGDLVIAPDGSLYATDSLSPVIWRLPPGASALEPWLDHDDFLSLQGLAFGDDGRNLYIADYANGLWRVDLTTRQPALLTAPANASFFGLDGLAAVPGGLVAVQNGINPQRVLRIEPAISGPSATRMLICGRNAMTDLALGQVYNGRFHFIGNSGWSLFDPRPDTLAPARGVTVYSTATK